MINNALPTENLPSAQRTLVFLTIMAGTFASSMAMIPMAIMLPPIMESFQITTITAQWLTSGASLVTGIMIPVAAWLIKHFPNKIFFTMSMSLFALGSLLGSIAGDFPLLLAGRLIQAAGNGLLIPFSQIILISIYPKEKHGTIMGYFTLGVLITPVISPYITGLIIDHLGWQPMFYIFLFLSLTGLVMGLAFMRNITERYNESFSVISVILSSGAFFGLMFGIGSLADNSIISLQGGGAILAGLVFMVIFIFMQLRLKNPLMDLRILQNYMFRTALLIAMCMYMTFMGGGTLLPIYVQSILGYSASIYALIVLPGSILMAIITVLSGKFYDRHGPKVVLLSGALFLFMGNAMSIFFSLDTGPIYIGIASFLPSAGIAILMPLIVPLAMSTLDDKSRVDGNALLGSIRMLFNGLVVTYTILLYSLISSMYDVISGVRASYISSSFFSIVLFFLCMFSINVERKEK